MSIIELLYNLQNNSIHGILLDIKMLPKCDENVYIITILIYNIVCSMIIVDLDGLGLELFNYSLIV